MWKETGEGLSDWLVKGTVKFGEENIIIWKCMSWEGIEYMCKIEGKINEEVYESILEDELMKTLEYYNQEVNVILFQYDNDSKHTCKRVKKWIENQELEILDWPAQSPDLNPIEHLWFHLKTKFREYEEAAGRVEKLWRRAEIEWEKFPKEKCQKLIESMSRRVAAVLRAKRRYTKY